MLGVLGLLKHSRIRVWHAGFNSVLVPNHPQISNDAMRASEANKHARSLFLGFVFFVLVAVCTCEALSSTECKQAVAEKYKNGEQDCGHPVCGYLEVDQTAPKFLESLSLQCQALMWDYRVDTSPMLGITSAAARVCATSKDAYQPTNPIIVETDDVNNFMMCTVPRAASTSLRQLLNMLIRLPDQPRPAIKYAYATQPCLLLTALAVDM